MKRMLEVGRFLDSDAGKIKVVRFIGDGGQGEVYEIEVNNKRYALKWYFPNNATQALYNAIDKLVKSGSPTDEFLWPKFLVVDGSNFGYVMDLRPVDYKSLDGWVMREFDAEYKAVVHACGRLAYNYHKLHSRGLSYQDISRGNVFFNPKSGEVLICDNDNVTTDNDSLGNIAGTPSFMAPEIVSGLKTSPNSDTDRFSLAILLFQMLTIGHPFDGAIEDKIKCYDAPAQRMLYGVGAVFIYSPNNASNRPVPGRHNGVMKLWDILPDFIKSLFIKTFTLGITDVNERVRESAWMKAFHEFEDTLYTCPFCLRQAQRYDVDYVKANNGALMPCTKCGKVAQIPRARFGSKIIMLENGTKLRKRHLINTLPDDETVIGEVIYKKSELSIVPTNDNWQMSKNGGHKIGLRGGQKYVVGNDDILSYMGVDGKIRF